MNVRWTFRLLVVVQHGMGVSGSALSFGTSGMPPALAEYATTPPEISSFYMAVGGIELLLTIITFIGLLAFWRPARWLYLISMTLLFVAAAFGPTVVQTSPSWSLLSTSFFLSGVVAALIYSTPVAEEFSRKRVTLEA